MKQSIDSKGRFSTLFSHEEHFHGDGSLLEPRYTPTRAEFMLLAQHYSSAVAEDRNDRERSPEDGISSGEYNRYAYALRRLRRIPMLLAEAPLYEGLEYAKSRGKNEDVL